jgi:hypothetical protein
MHKTIFRTLAAALFVFLVGLPAGAWLSILYITGLKQVEIHTLEFPMLLGSLGEHEPFHLLPRGTSYRVATSSFC